MLHVFLTGNYPVNTFSFNIRSDEMFLPGNRAGVLFSLHSPFEAVNPFENGIFLKPGRTYMIFVAMVSKLNYSIQMFTCCCFFLLLLLYF